MTNVEEKLRFVLTQTNDWLKYAEAKNGVLLAIDMGILVTLFSIDNGNYLTKATTLPAMVLTFLAVISLLVSFIPKLNLRKLTISSEIPHKGINLLFFAHIAKLDPNSYLRELYHQLNQENTSVSRHELDYAEQIVNNSRIAMMKYNCFTIGFWLSISATIFLLAGGIYRLITN